MKKDDLRLRRSFFYLCLPNTVQLFVVVGAYHDKSFAKYFIVLAFCRGKVRVYFILPAFFNEKPVGAVQYILALAPFKKGVSFTEYV